MLDSIPVVLRQEDLVLLTPNLQNIPAHAKDIRMIFKAPEGYSICGRDYSRQEPRSTAALSNDKEMIKAYDEGKDLYAVIASKCFHNSHYQNLEFLPTLVDCNKYEEELCIENNILKLYATDVVETTSGYKRADNLLKTDILIGNQKYCIDLIENDYPFIIIKIKSNN